MAKINILDSSIYNRIAAGEVVDRPYSIVKELVENSLDAGAKNITVTVERGGKELVCVSDDGAGIEKSELPSAILPHATSKIAKAEDLDQICTLGFRGEALASIAAVSKLRIRSKARGADSAYEICCEGGKTGEVVPCPLGEGTEISAESLFFNTPVRAKFLKTEKGEEAEISNFVARFILGNPDVAFRYFSDGKLSMQSFGGGLDEAIAAVYGAQVISDCYRIDAVRHGIRLRGFLGKPSFVKANRTYQSVFVNGRYVVNNTISAAISNAYASYLMKRQYPFYVLFMDIPPVAVDVNVHPNKSDVRFENNQIVYSAIYSVVTAVLDGNASALEFIVGARRDDASVAGNEGASFQENGKETESAPLGQSDVASPPVDKKEEKPRFESTMPDVKGEKLSVPFPEQQQIKQDTPISRLNSFFSGKGGQRVAFCDSESPLGRSSSRLSDEADAAFLANKKFLEAQEQKAKQQKIVFENAKYCGSLFNTYLLYEEGDAVYLIDQHAAHERMLFDRLKREMEERKVVRQPMLVPYVLNLNREEAAFFAEHLDQILSIGFEIEEFGAGSFKISAVPLDLQDIDLPSFFDELLGQVGGLRGIRLSEVLRDKIAMTACKHAIKGGMSLTESEKEKLFEMLHGDMGLKCPHGRPIAVRLSKYEIEKMFKRIV